MNPEYVPQEGQLIWLDFTPQAGHEQAGRRPAIVVSPRTYNAAAGLALVCPITSVSKGYPFEVALPEGLALHGNILADQVRSVDWRARNAQHADEVPDEVLAEVCGKLAAIIGT